MSQTPRKRKNNAEHLIEEVKALVSSMEYMDQQLEAWLKTYPSEKEATNVTKETNPPKN